MHERPLMRVCLLVQAGFKVDHTQAVCVDEEGEGHTLKLAKEARSLGGNNGYIPKATETTSSSPSTTGVLRKCGFP
eukprot:5583737-Pleurochrysis_carterae.AAC.2